MGLCVCVHVHVHVSVCVCSGKRPVRKMYPHLPTEVVLVWISPEADPETRICQQVIYLEVLGTLIGEWESDIVKGKQPIKNE